MLEHVYKRVALSNALNATYIALATKKFGVRRKILALPS